MRCRTDFDSLRMRCVHDCFRVRSWKGVNRIPQFTERNGDIPPNDRDSVFSDDLENVSDSTFNITSALLDQFVQIAWSTLNVSGHGVVRVRRSTS